MLILKPIAAFMISVFLIFFVVPVSAQPYYFRHFQVENGLSNNTIYCSIQDKTGFLWFGTKEGLNRFDGYSFKVFKFHSDEKDWAERELIYCLFNDDSGTLWVGTQKGLYSFDNEKEKLRPHFKSLTEINTIQTDVQGQLWFIAATTVYRFNQKTGDLKKFSPDKYFNATSICLSANNELWFATTDGRLLRFNEKTESFTPYNLYSHSPRFLSCSIKKIIPGGAKTIYIGTSCQGIKEFNTETGEYKDLLIYNSDKTPIYVRDILQYSESQFWFATESGIFILDKTTNTFTNLKKKYLDPYSLSDNAVYALCKDQEGGVWAGTYFGGINYYAKQYSTFQKYFADNLINSMRGSAIREIKNDSYGNLWIGTEDAGLNKLDPLTGKTTNFSPDGLPGSISYSNIHGLLVTDNEIWIGTHEHGLDIMDIASEKVIKHYNEGPGKGDLKNNFIVSILQTTDKNIYVGTGSSLHLYNKVTKNFSVCPEIPSRVTISTMTEAHDKTIWAGTHGEGVFYFNPVTGAKGKFEHKPGQTGGLTANTINSIIEDRKHNIWIGTEGGGVVRISPDRKTFTQFNKNDGLPSNFIFKVLEDKNGDIWLTSSKGLVWMKPELKNIKVYTTSSGLLNDQFNYNSGYSDSAGVLYFGSVKGMISFRPDKCSPNDFIPPVYITGFQVNNKEIKAGVDSGILKKAITHTSEVVAEA